MGDLQRDFTIVPLKEISKAIYVIDIKTKRLRKIYGRVLFRDPPLPFCPFDC